MNSIIFLTLMVCAAGLVTAIIVYFDREPGTDNNSGIMDSAEIIKALGKKMTDLLANPDCKLCHGTGTIRERRPDYWGMPVYEWVLCDCIDDNEAPPEGSGE